MDMEGRTPEAWYRSLPPLTRLLMTVTFVVTLASSIGIFNPMSITLDWLLVTKKLQLWRLFTDYVFCGAFSFGWMFHMYFLVTFSSKLEVNEMFMISPGAYLFFLVTQMLALDVLSLFLWWPTGKPMMSQALVTAIIYYWSRREPYAPIGLWGFTVQAYQFPFALLFLDLIMGQSLWVGVMGILSGHLYYVIRDVMPREGYSGDLLGKTPYVCDEIMRRMARFSPGDIVGSIRILFTGDSGQPPPPRPTQQGSATQGSRVWSGVGHRLGGNS